MVEGDHGYRLPTKGIMVLVKKKKKKKYLVAVECHLELNAEQNVVVLTQLK